MSGRTAKRKLAAILYADVAGYSRLTSRDELGTHQSVMEVLDHASESIKGSEGTVLRYAGDAILAEFPSMVGAVDVAVSIQSELAKRNAQESDDNKVQIRIGLNLGEVLQDRGECTSSVSRWPTPVGQKSLWPDSTNWSGICWLRTAISYTIGVLSGRTV